MDNPILFLVDDEPEVPASLAAAIKKRSGADYRIVTDLSNASTVRVTAAKWIRSSWRISGCLR